VNMRKPEGSASCRNSPKESFPAPTTTFWLTPTAECPITSFHRELAAETTALK